MIAPVVVMRIEDGCKDGLLLERPFSANCRSHRTLIDARFGNLKKLKFEQSDWRRNNDPQKVKGVLGS